ncbi:MAG: hypothetical protein KKB51_21935 [Candidatus Riflebacteria bacterium]|nr:hypothetical protein [Candidatus Riflebacteria bacterium]
MRRLLYITLLMVLSVIPLFAQSENVEIMSETTLLLPLSDGINTRWVLPPASSDFIRHFKDMRLSFSVDHAGHAWLGFADGTVLCPEKGYMFKLPETFWDFVCLDNGVILFATTSRLSLLRVSDLLQKTSSDTVSLQPIAMLPPNCSRMVKGAENCLYFICNDEAARENTIWLFKPQSYQGIRGIPEYQKVFVSDSPINAVAGDGVNTWVASGRLILKIDAQKQLHRYYLHPHQAIVDLAYTKSSGLFYTTAFATGYAGVNGAIELLNTRAPVIACAGNSLYVLFAHSFGVMAIEGIDQLLNYDLPLAGIKKVMAPRFDQ